MESKLQKVLSTKVGMMLAQKQAIQGETECPECDGIGEITQEIDLHKALREILVACDA